MKFAQVKEPNYGYLTFQCLSCGCVFKLARATVFEVDAPKKNFLHQCTPDFVGFATRIGYSKTISTGEYYFTGESISSPVTLAEAE